MFKKYTFKLVNINSVPENIHNLERCFEYLFLIIYQIFILDRPRHYNTILGHDITKDV